MRSEREIREEIERILEYRKQWPCSQHIQRECDLMVQMLEWVLENDREKG